MKISKSTALACAVSAVSALCATAANAQLSQEWRDLVPHVAPPMLAGALPEEVFDALKSEDEFSTGKGIGLQSMAWYRAARTGRWDLVLAALKADVPDVNVAPVGEPLVLNLAVRAGELNVVHELLKKGASPDAVSSDGFTALGLAAFRGETYMVKSMLRAGADPRALSPHGQTALHLAAAGGHVPVVEVLWPVSPVGQVNAQGRHAFAEAAFNGQLGVMQRMKALGQSVSALDANGLDAMHAAVAGRSKASVDWLQGQGLGMQHAVTALMWDQWQAGLNPPLFTYP
jgi:hypothetical protein